MGYKILKKSFIIKIYKIKLRLKNKSKGIMKKNSIVEISELAFKNNLLQLKSLAKKSNSKIMAVVKSNAYGHGMILISKLSEKYGVNYLGVNSIEEAIEIRESGINLPILILGYVSLDNLKYVPEFDVEVVIYNIKNLKKLQKESELQNKISKIHLKIETGTNRQGIKIEKLPEILNFIGNLKNIKLGGIYTHFANIEDTTDHTYAMKQLNRFKDAINILNNKKDVLLHTACSAATILFPETHFSMVRTGISIYGLWPSNETFVSAKEKNLKINLKPVLTWKSLIAQIKEVKAGNYIGYGCTYKANRNIKIGIVPVGYYEGYFRSLSNRAYVLVKGKRAQIIGRICMNMMIVDLTEIKDVKIEDEVILIGKIGNEEISADYLANLAGTINYEIVTRISKHIPRILIK